MTAQTHDPASQAAGPRSGPGATRNTDDRNTTAARPQWLLPGLLIGIVAAGLVVTGVLSLSTVLYAGLFGGMILMHLGGNGGHGGNGGQGGHGGGHDAHGGHSDDLGSDVESLSARSSGPQVAGADSNGEPDDRASTDRHGIETHDHDKHSSNGCH